MASREGHLLDILSFVHKDNLTPTPALLFNALIANLMILQVSRSRDIKEVECKNKAGPCCQGDMESLIDFFSFTVWIFYGMAMCALITLRWKNPEIARPYKVPIWIPVIVLIFSVFLVIAPIVNDPKACMEVGIPCAHFIMVLILYFSRSSTCIPLRSWRLVPVFSYPSSNTR